MTWSELNSSPAEKVKKHRRSSIYTTANKSGIVAFGNKLHLPKKEKVKKKRSLSASEIREKIYQWQLLGNLSKGKSYKLNDRLSIMLADLAYLKTLAASPTSGPTLAAEANAAADFLKARKEFWRQYKPMYSDKKALNR